MHCVYRFVEASPEVCAVRDFVGFDDCEDIEVGDVFVCDVALCVDVFDPAAAGVAAEEDYHLYVVNFFADAFDYTSEFISFVFW